MTTNELEAIVFDMDGVLRIGNKLIDGANEIFKRLLKRGIRTMIVKMNVDIQQMNCEKNWMNLDYHYQKPIQYIRQVWQPVTT